MSWASPPRCGCRPGPLVDPSPFLRVHRSAASLPSRMPARFVELGMNGTWRDWRRRISRSRSPGPWLKGALSDSSAGSVETVRGHDSLTIHAWVPSKPVSERQHGAHGVPRVRTYTHHAGSKKADLKAAHGGDQPAGGTVSPALPSFVTILLQVAVCAAAVVTDPVMGLIDAAFVARLGTVQLASMGPATTVFNTIAILVSASLAAATTETVSAALGRREAARGVAPPKRSHSTQGNARAVSFLTGGGDAALVRDQMGTEAVAAASNMAAESAPGQALGAALATALVLGTSLAAAVLVAPSQWLCYAACDPALLPYAVPYLAIRALALVPGGMFIVLQSALHAASDFRTPLTAMILGSLVNALLDPVLIWWAGWGPAGAAAATVVAELCQATYLTAHILTAKRDVFFLPLPLRKALAAARPPLDAVSQFVRNGAVLMTRAVTVVMIWTATGFSAAKLGVGASAAHQIVLSLQQFQAIAVGAFTTVATAQTARALAASGPRTAVRVGQRVATLALLASVTFAGVTWAAQGPLLRGFSSDPAVLAMAAPAFGPMCCMLGIMWFKALEGSLIGVGDGAFMASAFAPGAGACLACLALGPRFLGPDAGLVTVWMALLAYYLAVASLLLGRWLWKWQPQGI